MVAHYQHSGAAQSRASRESEVTMNNPIEQNPAKPGTAPLPPIAPQEAVTTRPPAAKGDDDLMSQPVKPS
jgi:hypothetical protein